MQPTPSPSFIISTSIHSELGTQKCSDRYLHAVASMICQCKCRQFLSNHAESFIEKAQFRIEGISVRCLPRENFPKLPFPPPFMQAVTSFAGLPTLRPWSLDIALRGRRQRNVLKTLIAPIPLTPTYSPTRLPQENWKLKGNKNERKKIERNKERKRRTN